MKFLAALTGVILLGLINAGNAAITGRPQELTSPSPPDDDLPVETSPQKILADTVWIGDWSFDNGGTCNESGWIKVDNRVLNDGIVYWTVDDRFDLTGGIVGNAAICGWHDLTWAVHDGYANDWYQAIRIEYTATLNNGPTLAFDYRLDSEPNFDFLYVEADSACASFARVDYVAFPSRGAVAYRSRRLSNSGFITSSVSSLLLPDYGGGTHCLYIAFFSDVGASPADGRASTLGAALVVDNIQLTGSTTLSENFEGALDPRVSFVNIRDSEPFGQWSRLFTHVTDNDVCQENTTCSWIVTDDTTPTVATDPSMAFGPGAYVVKNWLDDIIISPWVSVGTAVSQGTVLAFRRFGGNFFANSKILQGWAVRGRYRIDNTDTPAPGDSLDVVGPWGHASSWNSLNNFSWVTTVQDMSPYIAGTSKEIQVRFRTSDWQWINNDTAPSPHIQGPGPFLDRVRIGRVALTGPVISEGIDARTQAQDCFASSGSAPTTDRFGTCAFSAGNDTNGGSSGLAPGDSIFVLVTDARGAGGITSVEWYGAIVSGPHSGKAPAPWTVGADGFFVVPASGPLGTTWSMDLDDTYFRGGDVLHYFWLATDAGGGTRSDPVGLTSVPTSHEEAEAATGGLLEVSFLPTIDWDPGYLARIASDPHGDLDPTPEELANSVQVNDILYYQHVSVRRRSADCGNANMTSFMKTLDALGYKYDVYDQSGDGNANNQLGGRATVQQAQGYSVIVYDVGNGVPGTPLLPNGSNLTEKVDQAGWFRNWLAQAVVSEAGKATLWLMGSSIVQEKPTNLLFTQDMGVVFVAADQGLALNPDVQGSTGLTFENGTAVDFSADLFNLNGSCPAVRNYDGLGASGTAVATHRWKDPVSGTLGDAAIVMNADSTRSWNTIMSSFPWFDFQGSGAPDRTLAEKILTAALGAPPRVGNFSLLSLSPAGTDLCVIDVLTGEARSAGRLYGVPLSFQTAQLTSAARDETIFALLDPDTNPQIATLDGSSGTALSAVPVSASHISGLARDPFGDALYVGHGSEGLSDHLGLLDPASGAFVDLGALVFAPATTGAKIDLLAFSPRGELFGLDTVGPSQGMRLWRIEPRSLSATLMGTTPAQYFGFSDATFLGDKLWAIKASNGDAIEISVMDATVPRHTALHHGLAGAAAQFCASPSAIVLAKDNPRDEGQRVLLNWSSYAPSENLLRYDIFRALDPCELLMGTSPSVGSVPTAEARVFVDSGLDNYTTYFYKIQPVESTEKTRARRRLNQTLEGLFSGVVVALPNVVINEFAPSGGVPKVGNNSSPRILVGEFVELRNLSSQPIDLTGWLLSNGTNKETLSGTIPANGLFTHTLQVIDLPDAGGTLGLLPPQGTSFVVDSVSYGTEGGAPAVPAGFTISRVDGTDASDPDVTSFGASAPTPGVENLVAPSNLGGSIVMNEVYYLGTARQDYVELFNPLGGTIALHGFALSDGAGFVDTLSSAVALAPGGVVVVNDSTPDPFVKDLTGTQLYLYQFTSEGLLQLIDQLGWGPGQGDPVPPGPTPQNHALVRTPDGSALYLGDTGTNWLDCGGGVTLFYGILTPGQPNVRAETVTRRVGAGGGYTTIAAALQAASAGDVVQVAPGTYKESVTLKNGVSIVGGGESSEEVVITGRGGSTVMTGTNLGAGTLVSRVTLRGGRAVADGPFASAPASGGGLRLVNSSAVFQNVRFEFNVAEQNGGAVAIDGGLPRFDGCLFLDNHALVSGGAVWALSGSPTFDGCLFVTNESQAAGGALYLQGGVTSVQHSVLDGNASRGNGTGVVHAVTGGTGDVQYSMVTNNKDGAPLWVQSGGVVHFGCGVLYNHPEWYNMAQGGVDTTAVVLGNPAYCQPLALSYAYGSTSPVLALTARSQSGSVRCPAGVVGVATSPCGQTLTAVQEATVPRVTRLLPAVPNPFNPATRLRFELAKSGQVKLQIYDVRGRRVVELLRGVNLGPGPHHVEWRGLDQHGRPVPSGVYNARLQLDGSAVGNGQKLVVVR